MLERAGLDPAGLDERVDLVFLQPDHPAEPVGGDVALVDEPVQRRGVIPSRFAASAVDSQLISLIGHRDYTPSSYFSFPQVNSLLHANRGYFTWPKTAESSLQHQQGRNR